MKEIQQISFIKLIEQLEADPRFTLFHPGIARYKMIIKQLDNKEYFSEKPVNDGEKNHIMLEDGKKIYPTEKGWIWLFKHRIFTKEELERIENIKKEEVKEDTKSTNTTSNTEDSLNNPEASNNNEPYSEQEELEDRIKKAYTTTSLKGLSALFKARSEKYAALEKENNEIEDYVGESLFYLNKEGNIVERNPKKDKIIISKEKGDIEDHEGEDDAIEEDAVEDHVIEDDTGEDHAIEEGAIEDDVIEDDTIEDDIIEEDVIEDDTIEDDTIEDNESSEKDTRATPADVKTITEEIIKKQSNNLLYDRIQRAQKAIMEATIEAKSKNKEQFFYQELMAHESFGSFLYDYISHAILASKNTNYTIGVSKIDIGLGDKLVKFMLISKKAYLYDILLILEEKGERAFKDKKVVKKMIEFMITIYTAKDSKTKSMKGLLDQINIKSEIMREALYYYLLQGFYVVYKYVYEGDDTPERDEIIKGSPKLGEAFSRAIKLRVTMKNCDSTEEINETHYYHWKNEYKKKIAALGERFTHNILIPYGIFQHELEEKGGPEIKFNKKSHMILKTDRWVYVPEITMLKQILTDFKPDVPILSAAHKKIVKFLKGEEKYKLLYQQEDYFIHNNENILMLPQPFCYLSEENSDEMQVNYCVDIDYLKEFLSLLIRMKNEAWTEQTIFVKSYVEMHNINLNIYEQLYQKCVDNYNTSYYNNTSDSHKNKDTEEHLERCYRKKIEIEFIMKYLHAEIVQFEQYKTKAQILSELENATLYYKRRGILGYYKIKWKQLYHLKLIEEFVDKLCHRKLFIIRLLNDCIEHVIYHYFGIKHFVDSRGRVYPHMTYMNINANHPAKLFIKLYDVNEGAIFNEKVKKTISSMLNHSSTKMQVLNLKVANIDQQNERLVENYILSLCDQKTTHEDIQNLLNNPSYNNQYSLELLAAIKPKKEKERLFIHSLIRTERIIRLSKRLDQPKRFVNYAEKDARSSGLQMISILFRSASLAHWANLINGQPIDIYSTITKACKEQKACLLVIAKEFTFISHNILIQISLKKIHCEKISSLLEAAVDSKNELLSLFELWLNLDIKAKISQKERTDLKTFFTLFHQRFDMKLLAIFNRFKDEQYKELRSSILNNINIAKNLHKIDESISQESFERWLIARYAVRLAVILKHKFAFLEDSAIWDSRNLYKQAIMTRFYNSSSFGRRKDFIECINEFHLLSEGSSRSADFSEFLKFLDDFFVQYLSKIKDSTLLDQLSTFLGQKKEVNIKNSFFTIRIAPKIMEKYRMLIGRKKSTIFDNADTLRKTPQITIKIYKVTKKEPSEIKPTKKQVLKKHNLKLDPLTADTPIKLNTFTNDKKDLISSTDSTLPNKTKVYAKRKAILDPAKLVDHRKLKTMIGPNIIHSMDSAIVHYFRVLVNRINTRFQDFVYTDSSIPPFQLALEMNHDCYILSFPVLLPILLEDCYLTLCETNYLRSIDCLRPDYWLVFQRMSVQGFIKLLTPINPHFIK